LDTGEIVSKTEFATLRFLNGELVLENAAGVEQISLAMSPEGDFPSISIYVDDVVPGRRTAMGFTSSGDGIAMSVTDLTMGRNYSRKIGWKQVGDEIVLAAID
jgi:hypothetical protein